MRTHSEVRKQIEIEFEKFYSNFMKKHSKDTNINYEKDEQGQYLDQDVNNGYNMFIIYHIGFSH